MRVLIVTQYFWPENFSINMLAKILANKGLNVDVLTGKPNYPEGVIYPGYEACGLGFEKYEGINVFRVPILPRGSNNPLRLALNYLSFVVFGCLLAPWALRKRKYDVIFVYSPSPISQAVPALWLGKLKRIPVILWVQDLWPESLEATGYITNRRMLKAVEGMVKFIYRHVDLLLVQSKAFEEPVSLLASGTPVIYHPNTIEPEFSLEFDRELPNIDGLETGFPIVFAGNIGAGQGLEVVIEAAKLLKNYTEIRFVIIGSGSKLNWLEQQVAIYKLTNIYLAGRYPSDLMPGFFQKASALLITLANKPIFDLTVPNKLQAYMASGRPIVACLNGEGGRIVVEAKAGILISAGDGSGLAQGILSLYGMDKNKREQMGENAKSYFKKNFDSDTLTDKLIAIFKQYLK